MPWSVMESVPHSVNGIGFGLAWLLLLWELALCYACLLSSEALRPEGSKQYFIMERNGHSGS